jgi:hypothetical protein
VHYVETRRLKLSEDGLGHLSEDGLGHLSEDGLGHLSEDGLGRGKPTPLPPITKAFRQPSPQPSPAIACAASFASLVTTSSITLPETRR